MERESKFCTKKLFIQDNMTWYIKSHPIIWAGNMKFELTRELIPFSEMKDLNFCHQQSNVHQTQENENIWASRSTSSKGFMERGGLNLFWVLGTHLQGRFWRTLKVWGMNYQVTFILESSFFFKTRGKRRNASSKKDTNIENGQKIPPKNKMKIRRMQELLKVVLPAKKP